MDVSRPSVRLLQQTEISRLTHVIVRLRAVAGLALIGFGLCFHFFYPSPWRTRFLAVFGLGIIIITVVDEAFRRVKPTSGYLVYHVLTIYLFQTALILTTGGAGSPFLILYIVVALVAAFACGEVRLQLLLASFPVVIVWLLTLGKIHGFLDLDAPGLTQSGSTLFHLVAALIFTGVVVIGGRLALNLRASIDRATYAAARGADAAAQTMRERHRELLALAGSLAHELKNPLASIQGLAGVLARRAPEGGKEAEQLAVLLGEARRMGGILDELLNFSRPVASLAVAELGPADLVADVVLLHEGLASERGVTVRAEGAAAPLRADPRKLKQILTNLLQNALDASPAGSQVVVRVEPRPDGGAVFVVDDEGPGLAAEVRGRLFIPGTTSKAVGSGLGLVVARSLAEQHGGKLRLEEREGGGVRAVCELPAAPPANPSSPGGES